MLLLLFSLGSDRYAIDAAEVIEVLPAVDWKALPNMPPGVLGVFNRRGAPVPLIDLQLMLFGTAARQRSGTRIMVVKYPVAGPAERIGILAEKMTETIRRDRSRFVDAEVSPNATPALGQVTEYESSMLQLIHPVNLLPPEVTSSLYAAARTAA